MVYHANAPVASTSIPTTIETVVGVLAPPFNVNQGAGTGEGIHVAAVLNVTAGTGATALTVRVYRGAGVVGAAPGAGLTQVGPSAPSHSVVAGNSAQLAIDVIDAAELLGTSVQYTVTVQQTGATANGNCNYAFIGAEDAVTSE